MSFESMNPENRNAYINLPPRRCCSFCKTPGHNILVCSDIRLENFGRLCEMTYRTYMIHESVRGADNKLRHWLFNNWIRDKNLVKSYSIRYCSSISRSNMASCVNNIIITTKHNLNINPDDIELSNHVHSPSQEEPQQIRPEQYEERSNRFEFLQLIYPELSENSDLENFITFLMVVGTLRHSNNLYMQDRKFNIKTKIIEYTKDNLECECECNICYENYKKNEFIKLNCGHEFCKECIKKTLKNARNEEPCCAFCRSQFKNFEILSKNIQDEFNELLL